MCGCMLFCACEETVKVDHHLTYDAEKEALVEKNGNLSYLWAPISYEPAYVGDAFAEWDGKYLYTVKNWNPEVLLTEEYGGIGGLLYAESYTLPTLAEMGADKIFVCTATDATICILEIDEDAVIDDAVRYLQTGTPTDLPQSSNDTYYLKFHASKYEGIYYNIVYLAVGEDTDAQHYLYDRSTKQCVEIPYELFDGILYGEEPETTADQTDAVAT